MNNKRYQHILFDLDGTLTDPMIGITSSVKYALSYFNIEVEDLRSLCPFTSGTIKNILLRTSIKFTDEQADVAIAKYREYFSKQGIFENTLYQGIDELLRLLTENEMKIYLATSKPQPFAQQILEYFHLESYFTFVGGSTFDGSRSEKANVIQYVLDSTDIKHGLT